MAISNELAALFRRDITKIIQQVEAFPGEGAALWETSPQVKNSAGNLVLHLEGNLREYIGRQLGGTPYQRLREKEFGDTGVPAAELAARLEFVRDLVARVCSSLSSAQLEAAYPEKVLGGTLSTQQFLLHLLGHLNYHLGQIDYLRRFLTNGGTVKYTGLD